MYSAGIERVRPFVWALIALLVWQTTAQAEEVFGAALPEALHQAFPAGLSQAGVGGLRGQKWAVGPRLPTEASFRFGARRGADRGQKKRLTPRLFLSAGTALACGIAAWWSKEKADRAYEKYTRSASLRRQEKQFDRTERYDRMAGTAFVGMEAGLALTTYLLFF